MFTTNSRAVVMLRSVSLRGSGFARSATVKTRTGGLELATVKKLNGATLNAPSGLTVETNAIGRGTTEPIRSL